MKSEHRTFGIGVSWMLLSATCFALSFVFLKINQRSLNYFTVLFLRFFVPLLFVLFLLLVSWKWREIFSSKHIWLEATRSFCVLVSQYGIAFYLLHNTLLNATVLMNAAPLFIPLIDWIFFKRRPGNSTIIGALVAFLGVILVLHPDQSLFSLMSGIGLLAALGQAVSQVLYGLKPKGENLLNSIFFLFLFTALFSFLILIFQKMEFPTLGNPAIVTSRSHWFIGSMVTLMGLATLFNQYFRGLAYRYSTPSRLATFLYFSVFVSALADWLIFKEIPSATTIIGACLILLGGLIKIVLRARKYR